MALCRYTHQPVDMRCPKLVNFLKILTIGSPRLSIDNSYGCPRFIQRIMLQFFQFWPFIICTRLTDTSLQNGMGERGREHQSKILHRPTKQVKAINMKKKQARAKQSVLTAIQK